MLFSGIIITFILSMAVNFHPNEVQFVLIDYKGGGLAGAFENREKVVTLPVIWKNTFQVRKKQTKNY